MLSFLTAPISQSRTSPTDCVLVQVVRGATVPSPLQSLPGGQCCVEARRVEHIENGRRPSPRRHVAAEHDRAGHRAVQRAPGC